MSGAAVIVGALEDAGVTVVFGLPGVHNLALWEALRESSIRLVGVRHEQAAAYAADGWFRATGRVGVALTTTGPGAANTLGAVGEAYASRSGILVIATTVAHRPPATARSCTAASTRPRCSPRWSARPSGEERRRRSRPRAVAPVYLEIPTDHALPVRSASSTRARPDDRTVG